MVDDKSILAQVHELQVLAKKLREVKIDIKETFQVGVITTKLSICYSIIVPVKDVVVVLFQ